MKTNITRLLPRENKARILWFGIILIAFISGWMISGSDSSEMNAIHDHKDTSTTLWTCSMHPQIQQPEQGQCPICGMDLIPVVSKKSNQIGIREIALSERARHLAKIQVAEVERKIVAAEIRMVGKIVYDETRLGYITARVPGRIDRMFVDYTGIQVRKGDHLVQLYSPEIISTQQELIQTRKSAEKNNSDLMKKNISSIRERLRLWGLTSKQIAAIEKSEKVTDHITIYAPVAGIVIQINGLEGMYVETGTRIYTIADLSKVWLQMDAYERDVQWIRYGQEVEFKTEAYPGEVFKGKIAFINPVLNEKTRTIKVRVNVDNKEGKLKPGMFANAIVESKIAAGGKVMDPQLSGKWISPMHPEVIKDKPGSCDVCGMPLVRAEDLGYVSANVGGDEKALVIPASAALITGKRAVVYVQKPGREGVYEGREVVLGPRAGNYYIVKSGLRESEIIVVNGNFKIDSAIQILAKPSMMNPEGGVSSGAHQHDHGKTNNKKMPSSEQNLPLEVSEIFLQQMDGVYTTYFEIQYALSHDQLSEAKQNAKNMAKALSDIDQNVLSEGSREWWMSNSNEIKNSSSMIAMAQNLEESRTAFKKLSSAMINVSQRIGSSGKQAVLQYHCPMAFDNKGADWLQNKEGTENPYFGSKMFTCGTQEAILTHGAQDASGGHQNE